uniref:Uncharacterized protein n=1 Tax=Pipistrellus kuhlii TaxID=59472 RepID=A0A7J7YYC9_PIPKU|nr:hypothetical protein mPipKuh1_009874 [Pipistrellus kuhlii]
MTSISKMGDVIGYVMCLKYLPLFYVGTFQVGPFVQGDYISYFPLHQSDMACILLWPMELKSDISHFQVESLTLCFLLSCCSQFGSVFRVLACGLKGQGFDSSQDMPGLQAQSLVGGMHQTANQ